jgi:hypothetical protein
MARGVLRRLAAFQANRRSGSDASRARSCTRCAAARWPRSARCRSALLRQRRCHAAVRLLAGLYGERTGDDATMRELWPRSRRRWLDRRPGDPDGDGFRRILPRPNRVSPTRAGRIRSTRSSTPTAAWPKGRSRWPRCRAMSCRQARGGALRARGWARRAGAARLKRGQRLAENSSKASGVPSSETYALALDGAKQPCRVRTSNAGQVLFTGIARRSRRRGGGRLLRPQFFSGWGIRTVAKGEARYNPMSYHNGSIWPHDNALIALGLRALWLQAFAVERVFKGLFDAATYMEPAAPAGTVLRLPAQRGRGPTLYPVACAPQAWASATPFTLGSLRAWRSPASAPPRSPTRPCRSSLSLRRRPRCMPAQAVCSGLVLSR